MAKGCALCVFGYEFGHVVTNWQRAELMFPGPRNRLAWPFLTNRTATQVQLFSTSISPPLNHLRKPELEIRTHAC